MHAEALRQAPVQALQQTGQRLRGLPLQHRIHALRHATDLGRQGQADTEQRPRVLAHVEGETESLEAERVQEDRMELAIVEGERRIIFCVREADELPPRIQMPERGAALPCLLGEQLQARLKSAQVTPFRLPMSSRSEDFSGILHEICSNGGRRPRGGIERSSPVDEGSESQQWRGFQADARGLHRGDGGREQLFSSLNLDRNSRRRDTFGYVSRLGVGRRDG